MEWKLIYHRTALKFLKKLEKEEKERILSKLQELINYMEKGVLPIRTMDIKRLKGNWEGFFRLRVGDLRIIFLIDVEGKRILVYNIHFRERVY